MGLRSVWKRNARAGISLKNLDHTQDQTQGQGRSQDRSQDRGPGQARGQNLELSFTDLARGQSNITNMPEVYASTMSSFLTEWVHFDPRINLH